MNDLAAGQESRGSLTRSGRLIDPLSRQCRRRERLRCRETYGRNQRDPHPLLPPRGHCASTPTAGWDENLTERESRHEGFTDCVFCSCSAFGAGRLEPLRGARLTSVAAVCGISGSRDLGSGGRGSRPPRGEEWEARSRGGYPSGYPVATVSDTEREATSSSRRSRGVLKERVI